MKKLLNTGRSILIKFCLLLCMTNVLKCSSLRQKDCTIITDINFGNENAIDPIYVYISPSCLHCGKFLIEGLEKFISKYGNNYNVVVKFLPTTAKDIFIMKIIQNKAKNKSEYYKIFINYIKRAIATINNIKPTEKQVQIYKGSNTDQEMIKFQVIAFDFGFDDTEILNAFPDMNEEFEIELINEYKKYVKFISGILDTKELDLPLVVRNGKEYKSLEKAIYKK